MTFTAKVSHQPSSNAGFYCLFSVQWRNQTTKEKDKTIYYDILIQIYDKNNILINQRLS